MKIIPTTRTGASLASLAAGALVALACAGSAQAGPLGLPLPLPGPTVPSPTSESARTCTEAPSQAFADYGDQRGYVLLPGGDFVRTAGWQLSGGAAVVQGVQRDGSRGPVLQVPPGGTVVTPQFCVDLRYATARLFTRATSGRPDLLVGVLSPTGELLGGAAVGGSETAAADWAPTGDVSADPRFLGSAGRYRSASFVMRNVDRTSSITIDDVYLDPRMR